jgi:hypothetical protein
VVKSDADTLHLCSIPTGRLLGIYGERYASPLSSVYLTCAFQVDTRFSYCALSTLALLHMLDDGAELINKPKAIDFIVRYVISMLHA